LRSCNLLETAAGVRQANPDIDITVIVSFNRAGEILGIRRLPMESEQAPTMTADVPHRRDETLQRCTPMQLPKQWAAPLPADQFCYRFRNRKPSPQPLEKESMHDTEIL